MGFGRQTNEGPRVSAGRLASIAGAVAVAAPATPDDALEARRRLVEPDLSRIRPRGVEETPEQRKRRLNAKAVNFSMSFLARLAILGVAALFAWDLYQSTGNIHRGIGVAMFLMVADFGRVVLKAMEPGTK